MERKYIRINLYEKNIKSINATGQDTYGNDLRSYLVSLPKLGNVWVNEKQTKIHADKENKDLKLLTLVISADKNYKLSKIDGEKPDGKKNFKNVNMTGQEIQTFYNDQAKAYVDAMGKYKNVTEEERQAGRELVSKEHCFVNTSSFSKTLDDKQAKSASEGIDLNDLNQTDVQKTKTQQTQ